MYWNFFMLFLFNDTECISDDFTARPSSVTDRIDVEKKPTDQRNPNPLGKRYLVNWGPIRFWDVLYIYFTWFFDGKKSAMVMMNFHW